MHSDFVASLLNELYLSLVETEQQLYPELKIVKYY